jgi:hypothetical protein
MVAGAGLFFVKFLSNAWRFCILLAQGFLKAIPELCDFTFDCDLALEKNICA